MDWTAKIDQQQNSLLLTFYMFIFMALLVIRTGLDARGAPASFAFPPSGDDAPLRHDHLSPDQSDQLDRLYAAVLTILYAAEAIARRLAGLTREIYELMKQANAMTQSLRVAAAIPDQCKQAPAFLDTS